MSSCARVHRRDTFNEDNHRSQEVLHFSSSTFGELLVHRGKSLGEGCSNRRRRSTTWPRLTCVYDILTGVSQHLGRDVYNGFETNSGEFVVIYEWTLHWNKKMGKLFTCQEKDKIDNCKKQVSGMGEWCHYYYYYNWELSLFNKTGSCADPRSRERI